MIPQKIQALFNFIDYLDENKKEYIENYIPLCNELKNLKKKKSELKPDKNYVDKQQYDQIQYKIEEKFAPIKSNIYDPITNKLKELKIWSGDETFCSIWNNNISAISTFKKDFTSDDILQVILYKKKYLEFRTETNTDFLCLSLVFQSLDEILKELFDFFKDTDENEFENFETEIIKVDSLEEAVKGLKENKGNNVQFSIPTKMLYKNPNKKEIPNNFSSIKNEIIIGDKIETGNISNNEGQISIGKENTNKTNEDNGLAKKSFNWQKAGIITTAILTIIAIAVTFYLSK